MEITFNDIPKAISDIQRDIKELKSILLEKDNTEKEFFDNFFNIRQTAEFLHLSIPTLYDKVHKRQIPVCKRGNRLYFSRKELEEWLKAGRKKSISEIQQEAKESFYKKG